MLNPINFTQMDDYYSTNESVDVSDYFLEVTKAAQELQEIFEVSKYAFPIVIGILLAIGLLGNILVVYVSATTQRIVKHPVHSLLVLNLALADVIYLMASAPYQISANISPRWIYGSLMCPIFHFLNIQTMSVGIFTMCALAIMRFLALMMPFKIKKSCITTAGNKAGALLILLVWTLASALAAPMAYFKRLLQKGPNINASDEVYECAWNGEGENEYNISLLVVTFILPFFLVVILYFFIVRILCQMGKINLLQRKGSTNSSLNKASERSEYLRTTYMIFCLIGAFLFCWFPSHLFKMMKVSGQYSKPMYAVMFAIIEVIGYIMSYAHACVNPIIYTFAAPGFRRTIGGVCIQHKLKKRFHMPHIRSHRWSKSGGTSRRPSRDSTKMITMTNQDQAHVGKITSSINEKGSSENTTML